MFYQHPLLPQFFTSFQGACRFVTTTQVANLQAAISELLETPKTHPKSRNTKLGGHFGPEQKYLAPPPPQLPCRHPPGPLRSPPARGRPPPPVIFNKNRPAPPSLSPRTPPSPPPSRKNKKYPKRPPSKKRHCVFAKLRKCLFSTSISLELRGTPRKLRI